MPSESLNSFEQKLDRATRAVARALRAERRAPWSAGREPFYKHLKREFADTMHERR